MKFISEKLIEINRELSELDLFAIDFIKVLRKHTKYVIISGYVSILLGRARASEDIDIIIPKITFSNFNALFNELKKEGFYCLNSGTGENAYEYLSENIALRFAKEGNVIPNMELKCAKSEIDDITLNKTITVKIGNEELVISHLELQIAFKEVVLKSPKDIEDARHIRNVAKGHLDEGLIERYERVLHGI
ncbi:MAG: hypothetical protein WC852_03750 [Candidatus Nanoarchaeia archaeon]|jgi:hypothetical protein